MPRPLAREERAPTASVKKVIGTTTEIIDFQSLLTIFRGVAVADPH